MFRTDDYHPAIAVSFSVYASVSVSVGIASCDALRHSQKQGCNDNVRQSDHIFFSHLKSRSSWTNLINFKEFAEGGIFLIFVTFTPLRH